MKLDEAKELLEKLKPLENKKTPKNKAIHRFMIIPSDLIVTEKNYLDELWYDRDKYVKQENNKLDYKIISVLKPNISTYFHNDNIDEFISELNQC